VIVPSFLMETNFLPLLQIKAKEEGLKGKWGGGGTG